MEKLANIPRTMKILVVDDFSTMRRIVKNILSQLGFDNVDEAEDGEAALSKLRGGEFQFVISDWNMPNMMGIDLLREMRADASLKDIAFLLVTAEMRKENVEEAQEAGVSNYIVKPFTVDALQQKLETIFAT